MTQEQSAAGLTINFRGVRGSLPSPSLENMRYGGNTSCVEIRYRNQILILDAGSGIRLLGDDLIRRSASEPIEAALLISHAHWDHIQGLPFFAPGYSDRNRIRLFAAHGRAATIQSALVNQMSPHHFPVPLEQMHSLGAVEALTPQQNQIGELFVRTIELNHPGGCTGFLVQSPVGSLAYLPDHEPYRFEKAENGFAYSAQQALIEFLRGTDILILDTQYTPDEYAKRIGWGHGCLTDSVQLATEAGVRRLVLFHHDPSHTDPFIDEMAETARKLASGHCLTINAAIENELFILREQGITTALSSPVAPSSPPPPLAQCIVSQAFGLL